LGAILLAVVLASCGGSGASDSQKTLFVDTVTDAIPSLRNYEHKSLITAGEQVCSSLGNMSLDRVVRVVKANGIAEKDVGKFIGIAVGSLCPKHKDKIE
jgi:hypothetical protein